jgi:uncharacterized membrane protein
MFQKLKRILKHLWLDKSDTRRAISAEALARLTAHVAGSELRHSGELRIFVEAGLPLSYLWRGAAVRERALSLFGKLRVWDTAQNNGVLIYLLLADRAIELVADRGLNPHVLPAQWQAITHTLGVSMHEGHFEAGLMQALDALSAIMEAHFPALEGAVNANELPDQPEMG